MKCLKYQTENPIFIGIFSKHSFLKESVSQFYLTSTLSNGNVCLFQVLPLSSASTFANAFIRRLQCV
jgi:hypothetical protein